VTYKGVSIIQGTGAAIYTAVVVARCKVVPACLGSQYTKLYAVGRTCWFLRNFIWRRVSFTISQWIRQQVCIRFCANLEKSAMETLAMIRQAFGEESMSCTRKVQTYRDREGRDRRKSKAKSMLIIFWHQGIRSGRPNSQDTFRNCRSTGTAYASGWVLLRRGRWPVGPKSVFN
jgi:hypothetical protein